MNKLRFILIILALIMLVIHLRSLDYTNLGWSNNTEEYRLIIIMLCCIGSMSLVKFPSKEN